MKSKSGWVYVGESTRADGTKKFYVGKTNRKPFTRWGEHMNSVKSSKSRTWTGKGTFFKPLGALWSNNASKAEQTLKRKSPSQKRSFGIFGARKYKKRSSFW